MFRPSRKPRDGEDRFLVWKVRLFVVGAAVALVGMGLSRSWVVWAGMGVLLVALVLRFLPDGDREPEDDSAREPTTAGDEARRTQRAGGSGGTVPRAPRGQEDSRGG